MPLFMVILGILYLVLAWMTQKAGLKEDYLFNLTYANIWIAGSVIVGQMN